MPPRSKRASQRRSSPRPVDTPELTLVEQLMAIAGTSGQEGAVMEYVRRRLLAAGAPAEALQHDRAHLKSSIAGEVGNLILKLPGTVRAPRRMLSAHVDTVPVCIGSRPVRQGDVVVSADANTGLGADDRAGSAVLLATAEQLLQGDVPYYPTTFLWTVQEEVGLHGARHVALSKLGKPRLAFNFDGGSASKLTIGATGGYRMRIDVYGVASHAGGAPEEGVSAIAVAALAITDLVERGWHGLIEQPAGTGTSNVGVIEGGSATNVVTNHVMLRAEARSHDSKFRARIVREIEKAFERAARRVRNTRGAQGQVEIAGRLDYDSFRLAEDDPSVAAAQEAVRAEGIEPELAIANGGLDANWLTARGIPTVTLGCGQQNIHTVDEQLDIAQFELACRLARRLVVAE